MKRHQVAMLLLTVQLLSGCALNPMRVVRTETTQIGPVVAERTTEDEEIPEEITNVARLWVKEYLEPSLSAAKPAQEQLKDYKFESIMRFEGDLYLVNFSVLPVVSNTHWVAGSGRVEADGWIRHKVLFLTIVLRDGVYKVEGSSNISTP